MKSYNSPEPTSWAVAVFAAREELATLRRTLHAVVTADGPRRRIDVMVNGNAALAQALSDECSNIAGNAVSNSTLNVWYADAADKAEVWNHYVHQICPSGAAAFFVDGYAIVAPEALIALERALNDNPVAMAASGVPSSGRSAHRLKDEIVQSGGLHGNLYVMSPSAVDTIRRLEFRLPRRIYRTDSLLGAALRFGFEPDRHEWTPMRIAFSEGATWTFDTLSLLSIRDLKTHFKRLMRQQQGKLENAAYRNLFAELRRPTSDLPRTVECLVLEWAERCPNQARKFAIRNAFCALALRRLRMDCARRTNEQPLTVTRLAAGSEN